MSHRVIIVLFLLMLSMLSAVEENVLLGEWIMDDGKIRSHAFQEPDSSYSAVITWMKKPNFPDAHPKAGQPATDVRNPDESLRTRPVIGIKFLNGLEFNGKLWKHGRFYYPRTGKSYYCSISVKSAEVAVLRISLDIWGKLGKDYYWYR
ncbi:MAG: DUF2147 domain-containing protein, partial [Candidatus Cloacimonetes bacterium]|nr:DUF2147 domain-containing protein [Candidatus Cloacimonadota bacterium]